MRVSKTQSHSSDAEFQNGLNLMQIVTQALETH